MTLLLINKFSATKVQPLSWCTLYAGSSSALLTSLPNLIQVPSDGASVPWGLAQQHHTNNTKGGEVNTPWTLTDGNSGSGKRLHPSFFSQMVLAGRFKASERRHFLSPFGAPLLIAGMLALFLTCFSRNTSTLGWRTVLGNSQPVCIWILSNSSLLSAWLTLEYPGRLTSGNICESLSKDYRDKKTRPACEWLHPMS